MLVSELREILKNYKEEDLRLLVVELYKAMPKRLKEDKEIDTLIKEGKELLHKKKTGKAPEKQVDAGSLRAEIEEFLDHVKKDYYFAPNQVVPKKERPKWRFKVKAYIKSLQEIPAQGAEGKIAAELLGKLYAIVSNACHYYIFNTDDPFRSIGMKQSEFLEIALKKSFEHELSREAIREGIKLTLTEGVDRETLTDELLGVLVSALKTPDSREIAIEEADQMRLQVEEAGKAAAAAKKRSYDYSHEEYRRRENINHLVTLVLMLYVAQCEHDQGISYFKKHYLERDKEVALYVLLRYLYFWDLTDCWIREYETAVKRKIEPRESLKKAYRYIKEHGEMPEYL